jgi:sugar phosphate isomerase/epimerase
MIGLGTYAFFWHHSGGLATPSGRRPLDLHEMFERTAALGVGLFQVCDYAPLERMSNSEISELAEHARRLDLRLELGTRGVSTAHLARYLDLARRLDVSLVRSMLYAADDRPTLGEAEARLRDALRAYGDAGVTIALETYEQVSTANLVALVEAVGHPQLGICLDPANTVAALENPREVIERTAPLVVNIHVKDFRFARREGWVGFTLEGAPLGTGLLDYASVLDTVRPDERGINQIVEHWLPPAEDLAETLRLEDEWNDIAIAALRDTGRLRAAERQQLPASPRDPNPRSTP